MSPRVQTQAVEKVLQKFHHHWVFTGRVNSTSLWQLVFSWGYDLTFPPENFLNGETESAEYSHVSLCASSCSHLQCYEGSLFLLFCFVVMVCALFDTRFDFTAMHFCCRFLFLRNMETHDDFFFFCLQNVRKATVKTVRFKNT